MYGGEQQYLNDCCTTIYNSDIYITVARTVCAHTTVRTATHCHAHYPHTQPRRLPHSATNPLPECCHPLPHTAARIHCRTLPHALPHTVAHCRKLPRALLYTAARTAATAAHCCAHCQTLPSALPHTISRASPRAHCCVDCSHTLPSTATHCHTLPHTAAYTAKHSRAHCCTALQYTAGIAHSRTQPRTLPYATKHTAAHRCAHYHPHCHSHCHTAAHCHTPPPCRTLPCCRTQTAAMIAPHCCTAAHCCSAAHPHSPACTAIHYQGHSRTLPRAAPSAHYIPCALLPHILPLILPHCRTDTATLQHQTAALLDSRTLSLARTAIHHQAH